MKPVEKHLLNEWILQQSEFSKNDLLVSVDDRKTVRFSETILVKDLSKIISVSQNSIKESGINPLCQAIGVLNWEWNNQPVTTPIWLVPCAFKLDKVRETVQLFPDEEAGFLNPFLAKKIAEVYGIELAATDPGRVFSNLKESGLEDIDPEVSVVGNFHHHRYTLLKELEELAEEQEFSPCLKQFLSGERPGENTLQLADESLLPYDTDHRSVFHLFSNENCVVQGPPGTGKSQLLTNLIGKLLTGGHSTVFVSEKRAALEVIRKRLSSCNLEQLSVIATDDLPVRDFITDLKRTWEFLDEYQPPKQNEWSTRKELENNLQFILDILNQPELIGGVSFSTFNRLLTDVISNEPGKEHASHENFHFLSNPPLLNEYEKTLSLVKKMYAGNLAKSCAIIPSSALQKGNLAELTKTVEATKERVVQLEQILPGLSQNSIEQLQYQSVVYQLFQNELAKKYASIILPGSKEQKKFLKLHKEYTRLQKQVERSSGILPDWKIIPSELELAYLGQLTEKNGFLRKLKLKKRWSAVSHLPVSAAQRSIGQLNNYQALKQQLLSVEEQLARLGISDLSETDLLKSSLHLFSEEKWDTYNDLTAEKRKLLSESDRKITILKETLRNCYRLDKNLPISGQLDKLLRQLPQLMTLEQELKHLSQQVLDAISASDSFESYCNNILGTHQAIFRSHYPTLSAFEPHSLKEKVKAVLIAEQKENRLAADTILIRGKKRFEAYNQLLNTPAAKLTTEQKELRQQLKKGKSILVKEFSKTRQHPALRELMGSEARLWIRLLKPVWLTNPVQLAKTFPLEQGIFDACIMDEASQMAAQNGTGALQRSNRAIIAGDDQQMPPASYFRAGAKETTSVLQHAAFYLPKVVLTHHYRSRHAPLIAFSNRYFYNDKLVVYPSFPVDHHCITRHFCTGASYIDRKNKKEAAHVAEIIRKRLATGKTIGIVAFSQEQADAIQKALPPELLEEIHNRMEQDTLFLKPLEKVQGDECEHLIISLGYAPGEGKNFHLRFGPLNTGSGRNRLNVLFSRASETIDFVCSIESAALQWSENESIQLLFKWLRTLEQAQEHQPITFPLGLNPVVVNDRLIFKDSYTSLPDALEFLTTYSVLSQRGWTIDFK